MFKSLLTLLLALQMLVINLLPAGVHLTVCFGPDGHFDLSQEFCVASSAADCHPAVTPTDTDDHHDDCLDVAAGCVAATPLHSVTKTTLLPRDGRQFVPQPLAPPLAADRLPLPHIFSPVHAHVSDVIPRSRTSLRSVVLRI